MEARGALVQRTDRLLLFVFNSTLLSPQPNFIPSLKGHISIGPFDMILTYGSPWPYDVRYIPKRALTGSD